MSSDGCQADPSLLSLARQTQQARFNCSKHFPKNVFRDSAWDIMLELFAIEQEGRKMCVKETMAISGESATSTIRRLEGLEEAGLIFRRYDPMDHRRMLVHLTIRGREAMVAFLHHLFEVGDPPGHGGPVRPISFVPRAPRRTGNGLRDCN